MATKKQTVEQLAQGEGCLGKAFDNEPVFVLRGQDQMAPSLIESWADRLQETMHIVIAAEMQGRMLMKIEEARAVARDMRRWQQLNHSKVPD
jgi:hypothetical protein